MSETTVMTTIDAPSGDAITTDPNAPTANTEPESPAAPAEPEKPKTFAEKLDLAKKFSQVASLESKAKQTAQRAAQERRQLEQERQAFASEQASIKKAKADLDAELEEFRRDPVGYELKHGRDPVEVVRRASAPETDEQKRMRMLEEKIAAREKADEDAKTEAEKRAETERSHGLLRNFVREITPDECPNLTSMYPAQDVPKLVEDLLQTKDEYGQTTLEAFREQHGRNPSNKEIRQALEHNAAIRAKDLYSKLQTVHGAASQSVQDPNASQNGTRGPSLSNQHAGRLESSSSGPGRPLTLEEKRARSLGHLRDRVQLEAETES